MESLARMGLDSPVDHACSDVVGYTAVFGFKVLGLPIRQWITQSPCTESDDDEETDQNKEWVSIENTMISVQMSVERGWQCGRRSHEPARRLILLLAVFLEHLLLLALPLFELLEFGLAESLDLAVLLLAL